MTLNIWRYQKTSQSQFCDGFLLIYDEIYQSWIKGILVVTVLILLWVLLNYVIAYSPPLGDINGLSLTRSFTCLSGQLWITTRRRARIRLRRHPLQPGGRIGRQRCGTVVLVLFLFQIVLSCRTYFSFACRVLYCIASMYDMLYILLVLEAPHPGRQPK
jgi:hypothetical protein